MLSEILSHDSLYVKDCIDILIKEKTPLYIKKISFWPDNARHFRSGEILRHLYGLAQKGKEFVSLNFFTEYHGKSLVDGNFGILQKELNKGESKLYIKNLKDLLSFFENTFKNSYFFSRNTKGKKDLKQ